MLSDLLHLPRNIRRSPSSAVAAVLTLSLTIGAGASISRDRQHRAGSLAAIEAFDGTNVTLTQLGAAERLSASDITLGFLTLLGIVPARGRAFDLNDVGRPLAIVSHAFWHGTLAADPSVVGRQVVLGGQAHTIVGVLPEEFFLALNPCDVWRPLPVRAAQAAAPVIGCASLLAWRPTSLRRTWQVRWTRSVADLHRRDTSSQRA